MCSSELEIFDTPFTKLQNVHMKNNHKEIDKDIYHIFDEIISHLVEMKWSKENIHQWCFDIIIKKLVTMTHSKLGCICVLKPSEEEQHKLQCTSYYTTSSRIKKSQIKFGKSMNICHDTNDINLFMLACCKKINVISNNVEQDPRLKCQMPSKHIPIKTFLSIPICNNSICVGQIVLVNRSKGYTSSLVERIFPLFPLVGKILYSYDNLDANILIENVEDLKHHFLATMSHEIRTPLSGIVGMISLLQDAGPLNERQKDYLKRALGCCCQLMEIIGDILDFSKMKSGNLSLLNELFDLKECIQNAIDVVTPRATNKNIQLYVNVDENVPSKVYGDGKRLRQVLVNILNNGVKFTNEGNVTLRINCSNTDDEQCNVHFFH